MKILLINANPVVSRLIALCTRETHLFLDEVTGIGEVEDGAYDLIFVDDGVYDSAVDTFLQERDIRKKIFISYVREHALGFDESIQKPFLPSQIFNVIKSIDMNVVEDGPLETDTILPLISGVPSIEKEEPEFGQSLAVNVLDGNEIEKIKALLAMEDEETETIDLSNEEEVYLRKLEVIKEQLISEGLEILDEEEIINVLSAKTKEKKASKTKKNKMKQKKVRKKKEAMRDCSNEELQQLESAVMQALAGLKPKKMKKFLKGKGIELKIKQEDND